MFTSGAGYIINRMGTRAPSLAPGDEMCLRAEREALRALNPRCFTLPPLSERLAAPQKTAAAQDERREALRLLLFSEETPRSDALLTDAIAAICAEEMWSRNPQGRAFEDPERPEIDFCAAETAMLLAWTLHLCRPRLKRIDPALPIKLAAQIDARFLAPAFEFADAAFWRGDAPFSAAIVVDLLLTTMLCTRDENRAARRIRLCLRTLDALPEHRTTTPTPLRELITDTAALADAALLLRDFTEGYFDATQTVPSDARLDAILYAWIDGATFLDPTLPVGRVPQFSGADIYRIGVCACDGALTALGANVYALKPTPCATVTGALMLRSQTEALTNTAARIPRPKHGASANNALMMARADGMFCALTTGAHPGDYTLYDGGAPIFTGGCLPRIGRNDPQTPTDAPLDADLDVRPGRDTMSIDMTAAWPPAAQVRTHQRALLVLRDPGVIRLMDALTLSEPATVCFTFPARCEVQLKNDGAHIGALRLTWEGGLQANLAADGRTLTFTTPQEILSGRFAFTVARE